MSLTRKIKRYPNRRLYDFAESRYIGTADLRKLIAEKWDIVVQDATTHRDITQQVLLRLLIEEQKRGTSLTVNFLQDLIRLSARIPAATLSVYLDESLRLLGAPGQQTESGAAG
jgi:polyhydroxyalkanoate synthesis repressor PhaR